MPAFPPRLPVSESLLLAGAAVAALSVGLPAQAAADQVWRGHADHVLGTSFDMAVTTANPAQAQFAFAAARAEIDRLDRIMSGWRADSELSALNAADVHLASEELFAMLSACEAWRARTDGAFNPGLGAVSQAWKDEGQAPSAEAVCAASQPIALDHATRTITRPQGVRIAPDGLAKGYILDAALSAARRAAPCAKGMLIDIGGDILCFGQTADGAAWRVGAAALGRAAENDTPAAVLDLKDQALAVSGPGPRDTIVDGQRLSHLIDPVTGRIAPRQQVSVVAPRAADADAAATALAVLPPAAALAMAERLPGVEAMIETASGEALRTSGWRRIEAKDVAPCQAVLPAGYAVDIGYTLPKLDVGNYKRPYVVIWVTDGDKNLVKNVLIAGARSNWMEGAYVWYRRIGRDTPGLVEAQGKPTRAPGQYSVVWDGTNEAGQRVPQGDYIVHIEAAREHGGHAYQAIPVTLGSGAAAGASSAKDELGSAQVRYGKK